MLFSCPAFFGTFYVFGSCFRMLAVILVSDFCYNGFVSYNVVWMVLFDVCGNNSNYMYLYISLSCYIDI